MVYRKCSLWYKRYEGRTLQKVPIYLSVVSSTAWKMSTQSLPGSPPRVKTLTDRIKEWIPTSMNVSGEALQGSPPVKTITDKFRDWVQIGIPSEVHLDPDYPGNKLRDSKFCEQAQGHLRFAGWSVAASDFAICRDFKEARRYLVLYKQWKVHQCWEELRKLDHKISKEYEFSAVCFEDTEKYAHKEFKPVIDNLDRMVKEYGEASN
jgi:hypothetical protein